MKILNLTPGTGSFHCGSCLRDNALVKALRGLGHDAMIAPLYLPLVTDADEASPGEPVRVGGISLYLQEKMPWFRHLPRFVHRWLDQPALLRWASRRMGMTGAKDLGRMTVGSLLGEKSPQWAEWGGLVDWIAGENRPDVVLLSNSLLCGLAPALQQRGIPVVCSLQGEDGFLDTLIEPYRTQAWELLAGTARSVARFVAPSRFYAETMAGRLRAEPGQMRVVYNGLDFGPYDAERREPEAPVIGYLARMIHGKGLTTLVDAFIRLASAGRVPGVRLRIGGAVTSTDEPYLSGLRAKIETAGLSNRVSWEPNLSFEDKVKFLHGITVFSVPATCGEAFGLYVVEAQACGVPVVQPRHGAFPELLEVTHGGLLCEPDDPAALAAGLERLLLDPAERARLSGEARRRTRERFSAARMAQDFGAVLNEVAVG